MVRGRQRNKTSPGLSVAQTSPFLNLPAELRNTIYEYTVQNTDAISVKPDRVLYSSALSFSCSQVREEYRQIYLQEAAKHANRVNVHITNFIYRHPSVGEVSSFIERLPPPVPGGERRFLLRIYMTNFWDRHRLDLRNLVGGNPLDSEEISPDAHPTDHDIEVRWDPKSFDVNYFLEELPKLRFCHGRTPRNLLTRPTWAQLESAFQEALERYNPKAETVGPKRKRKRR